jgi:hypothetical protein
VVGVLVLVIYVVPAALVSGHLTNADRLKAENDIRSTLIQLVGGTVLLAGVYFTARTLQLNREGQVTDRFTKAIEQLGNEKLDVRLGGIYALERIAWDSQRDHEPIVEILTAFLREHADKTHAPAEDPLMPFSNSPADVTAALEVLGRRADRPERRPLDLRRIQVNRAHLEGAKLRGAILNGAVLRQSYLQRADLYGAILSDADLVYSDCTSADLRDTSLDDSKLQSVKWEAALLDGARLHGASYNREALTTEQLASAHEGD